MVKVGLANLLLAVLFLGPQILAEDVKSAVAGEQVTLKGVLMCACSAESSPAKGSDKELVLFAVEGPPEVSRTLDEIMKEYWPGDSLDGDQARKFQEQFEKRLMYWIVPGKINPKEYRWGNPPKAVTGVISEKDGKKWMEVSKLEDTRLKYPAKMLAPDKPFKMPGKEPLMLKITDTLSLKCIRLPAGKLLTRDPFYLVPRWDDPFPFMVTLTKPFYLSEIPVTQKMWESVMTYIPSEQKGPQIPVHRVPYTNILKFCQILSEKNGRTVRLPSECEWEYAARVGTSSPAFKDKYAEQHSGRPKGGLLPPVKSRPPNAWGLYDMASCAFELTGDMWGPNLARKDGIDLRFPPSEKMKASGKVNLCAKGFEAGSNYTIANHEGVGDGSEKGYNLSKFRILVEATPEEIAEMEKAAGQ